MSIQLVSSVALALSGLLITLVSAFFSVHGFLLFLPASDLQTGILGLGIAFEVAKIVGCTFLFHSMKDRAFPWFFKSIMLTSMLALIVFSSIFSFVHLNSSASASLSSTQTNAVLISQLEDRNASITEILKGFDAQISNVPANMNTARMRLYDKFKEERAALQAEFSGNSAEIVKLQTTNTETDQFKFLTNFSQLAGVDKTTIFTVVILFIVVIIDPLAISLFLSASYIFVGRKPKSVILKEESPAILQTPSREKPVVKPEDKAEKEVFPPSNTTNLFPILRPDTYQVTEEKLPLVEPVAAAESVVEEVTIAVEKVTAPSHVPTAFDTREIDQFFRSAPPNLPLKEVGTPEPEAIEIFEHEPEPIESEEEPVILEPTVPTHASIEPAFDDGADAELELQLVAATIPVEEVDTNRDGAISSEELIAAAQRLPGYVKVLKLQATKK